MIYLKRGGYCLLAALVGVTLAGCPGGSGETLVTVTGKVVDAGQPVAFPEGYEEGGSCLEVELIPLDESGNVKSDSPSYTRFASEDGSFLVDGNQGEGIPAGKYRVAVYRRGETDDETGDVWAGKFDAENTPFVFDVTGDEELVVDISKPQG